MRERIVNGAEYGARCRLRRQGAGPGALALGLVDLADPKDTILNPETLVPPHLAN
jgi:hypothetical protein